MRSIEEYFSEFYKRLEEVEEAPKAMAYLRILGTELGYLKTNELSHIIQNINAYTEVFKSAPVNVRDKKHVILTIALKLKIFVYNHILLSLQLIKKLTSSLDNEVFVHYMFLDKAFTLPTSAGFPLKFSLSGVLAPGAKGGLTIDRQMVNHLTSVAFYHLTIMLEFVHGFLSFPATAVIHAIRGGGVYYPNGRLYPRVCGNCN